MRPGAALAAPGAAPYAARVPRTVPFRACVLAVALLAAACGGSDAEAKPDAKSPASTPAAPSQAQSGGHGAAAPVRPSHERPLPQIAGTTLDGRRAALSDHLGRRLLIFFFNPEVPQAAAAAKAVTAVGAKRAEHNFAILGVAVGSDRDAALRFA